MASRATAAGFERGRRRISAVPGGRSDATIGRHSMKRSGIGNVPRILRAHLRRFRARRGIKESGAISAADPSLTEGFRRPAASDILARLRRDLSEARARMRRAGREERCDDREAPDEAKRNRQCPWGQPQSGGGKKDGIPNETRKASGSWL